MPMATAVCSRVGVSAVCRGGRIESVHNLAQ
jgi:hypothetical protein